MNRTFAAGCLAAAVFAVHAETPGDYAYRLPLTTTGDAAFFRVDLPAQVYESAVRRDLGDVRVFNAEGGLVAFAFMPRPAAAREAAASVALPLFPLRVETGRSDLGDIAITLKRNAAGTTVDLATRDGKSVASERLVGYLIDASDLKEPLSALSLPLPAGANVTTQVRVEASDDLAAWRNVVTAPLVELEFGGRRLSRDRIELPSVSAKYLRLTFEARQAAPELTSVRGEFADRAVEAPRQWRNAAGVADTEHANAYTFDLGGTFPVDRIALALAEQNTVAPAQVLARATSKDEWRPIASTVFYRIRQDGGEATNPPLAIRGGDYRYWQIVVDPKAGAVGAKAPQLSAGYYPGTIVFAARGNGPFELAYGSARAAPAALPIETLVPGYDRANPPSPAFPLARTGAPNAAPAGHALETPVDAKRWLLWGSLALASIVLGWMAFSLSQQMRRAPPASTEGANDRPPESR
jgi:hypothetical protein